jgi:hypothetical protein
VASKDYDFLILWFASWCVYLYCFYRRLWSSVQSTIYPNLSFFKMKPFPPSCTAYVLVCIRCCTIRTFKFLYIRNLFVQCLLSWIGRTSFPWLFQRCTMCNLAIYVKKAFSLIAWCLQKLIIIVVNSASVIYRRCHILSHDWITAVGLSRPMINICSYMLPHKEKSHIKMRSVNHDVG